MALNSFNFLILFAVVFVLLAITQLLKRFISSNILGRVQIITLLVFSYINICIVDVRFFICVLATTIFIYFISLLIGKSKYKKTFLTIGVTGLLLSLCYFKYTNFFVTSFASFIGGSTTTLNIILPVGISFYTFSAISYLVDIYRKKYDATRNVIGFSLYIAFFPKFVSGPIVRGDTFFNQVRNYRGIKLTAVHDGIQIFVFGLFKKFVLSNHLAVFVDDVFLAPEIFNSGTVIWAVISYSLQIYFDFSGYSDMAIGIAKMVGFDFDKNFNLPYCADSFSDFWKRWHISLSSFFADYLYIPLGGSKKGILRTCINLMVVMVLSGLWHGAGLTFIVWGLLHGVVSVIEHLLRKKDNTKLNTLAKIIKTFCIYVIVTLLWIPFRATSMQNALDVLKACFSMQDGVSQPYMWTAFSLLCLIGAVIYAYTNSKKDHLTNRDGSTRICGYYPIMNLKKFVPLCMFFVFCGLVIILGYFGDTAFIYGNF